MEDTEDFTSNILKLIIKTRLDMESEFQDGRKKRLCLWGKVLQIIKEIKPDFQMTEEQMSRKFSNMQTTYKRIKNRINLTGRSDTLWEFFDLFDEVYGTRYPIKPPLEYLQSSLDVCYNIQELEREIGLNDTIASSETLAEEYCSQRKKRKKIKEDNEPLEFLKEEQVEENETLNFLKEEAKKDDERHKEMIKLERLKIEVEKERIKALVDLNNTLQKFLEKKVS